MAVEMLTNSNISCSDANNFGLIGRKWVLSGLPAVALEENLLEGI